MIMSTKYPQGERVEGDSSVTIIGFSMGRGDTRLAWQVSAGVAEEVSSLLSLLSLASSTSDRLVTGRIKVDFRDSARVPSFALNEGSNGLSLETTERPTALLQVTAGDDAPSWWPSSKDTFLGVAIKATEAPVSALWPRRLQRVVSLGMTLQVHTNGLRSMRAIDVVGYIVDVLLLLLRPAMMIVSPDQVSTLDCFLCQGARERGTEGARVDGILYQQ